MNAAENIAYQRLTVLQLTEALGNITPPAVNMLYTATGFMSLKGLSNSWSGFNIDLFPSEK
jgi:hypothetical protein